MMNNKQLQFITIIMLSVFFICCKKQDHKETDAVSFDNKNYLKQLITSNQDKFLIELVPEDSNNVEKAKRILNWLSSNFDWLATDYKQRTVQEIIERGGGNCHELAMVTLYLYEKAGIKKRKIKEINIQELSERRHTNALNRINEVGNTASVFGRLHNDHVWIEIYDEEKEHWLPVDPTMNIFGVEQWIASRLAFKRVKTISPYSKDMLVPISVFAINSETKEFIDRSNYYLIDALNQYYHFELKDLEAWQEWSKSIKEISKLSKKAFKGDYNLHNSESKLHETYNIYNKLKLKHE
nr:transglutaminase family protein [uncultured Psychroserpens sp.]